MATVKMYPNPNRLQCPANGRTYTGVLNTISNVQEADRPILEANGWAYVLVAPVNQEVPTGACNGVNTTFVLAHAAFPGTIKLQKNGQALMVTTDYTLASDNLTITALVAPGAADVMTVDYTY